METLYILGSVAIVSLVSLTGAFTLSFREEWLKKILFLLVSLAIGALLGDAFLHLIPESYADTENPIIVSFLILSGIFIFFLLEKVIRWHHHGPLRDPHGTHHLGRMVIISDSFHNFIDGIIIAISYMVSIEIGIATTIAIILHEIPQEMGDFGVLIHAGYEKGKALLFNLLSGATAFGGAVLVLLIGTPSEFILNSALSFVAGVFIYIAMADLVPELHKGENGKLLNVILELIGITIGVFAMFILLFLE